ncbi:hypothetical protein BRADI_1g49356v3 [Brachypodium distachyon]|uniref:RNase H type-1 domain-containing protein n=1 Tax=Brachypodium distachyon TaxID=15368 RepID=A0A0Q3H9B5_BRADI|nr:hypothetical protein BRADI_1g49356v3 [Brachypodium distachyon]
MAPTSACAICGEPDSWRHSLIECNMSRCVWALASGSLLEHMEKTSEPDAKQRIFAMIESLPHDELTRCFVTLWAIWYARRKEKARPPNIPMPTARWIPPPAGYVKINVDASVAKHCCAGAAAAVCWNAEGCLLGASALVFTGLADPGTLEVLACREALSLAEDLGVSHCQVASDCLEVVTALKR